MATQPTPVIIPGNVPADKLSSKALNNNNNGNNNNNNKEGLPHRVMSDSNLLRRASLDDSEDDDDASFGGLGPTKQKPGVKNSQDRITTPSLERDMWNQSLYLPNEFTNPPENVLLAKARDEEDDFTVTLEPITVDANAKPTVVPLSPSRNRSPRPSNIPQTASAYLGDVEAQYRVTSPTQDSIKQSRCVEFFRYLKTQLTYEFFFRVGVICLGILFCVLAVLLNAGRIASPKPSTTSGVLLWKWLAFVAIGIWCYPASRLVVKILEILLWYAKPAWTTSTYYYLRCTRTHVGMVIITIGWLIAWNVLIYNSVPKSTTDGFFYGTQVFWLLFIGALLLLIARLARELSASYFEKTTFWALVSDTLKREYFLFACCPGTPVPSPVVLTYHRAGEEATRSDPRVLRQCTKYLRRHCITGYDNVHPGSLTNPLANVSGEIEISHLEDVQDLAEIIFDHVWNMTNGYRTVCEEDTARSKLKALKLNRGIAPMPAVRTMFSAGHHHMMTRAASSAVMLTGGGGSKGTLEALGKSSSSNPIHVNPNLNPIASQLSDKRKGSKKKEPEPPPPVVKPQGGRRIQQRDFEMKMFTNKEQAGVDAAQVWETIFDPHKRGYCTKKYLKNNLLRFYNERLGLGHTLKDSQAAVDRLGSVYSSIALAGACIAAALLFAGPSSYNVWIGITSFFVTLAVVFGNSLKVMCENIVFIFFRHPYDVGDLIQLDGTYFSVRKLELLSTTLIRWNGYYFQIDNTRMAQSQIFNLTRSGLYWELLEAYVDIATCNELFLNNIREHLTAFIQANPDTYSGKLQIIARHLGRPLMIKIQVFVEFAYRPTNLTKLFQDIGRLTECFAGALRKFSATEAGVGLGAVRANGDEVVPFLVPANGLFGRAKAISDALGL